MIKGDMELKLKIGRDKIKRAIEQQGGTALMTAGITSMVPGIASVAAVDAGVKMIEISQNGVALNLGLHGVTNRSDARRVSYQIPMEDMAAHVRATRNVVPRDIFISVGVPGIWAHTAPTPFTEDDAKLLSLASADCLHSHKITIEDHIDLVEVAHKYGLLVEGYISTPPTDLDICSPSYGGLPAANPKEIQERVKELEDVGVDLIGLSTDKRYVGAESGELTEKEKARVEALVEACSVPTIIMGGVTPNNAQEYEELGVQILIVGTAFDDVTKKSIKDLVAKLLK